MEADQWDGYADDYHDYVISPLKEGRSARLLADLQRIPEARILSVADIGTGRGELLPFLSRTFGQVHAIDFSKRMLSIARKHKARNVAFHCADMRELSRLGLRFDVAIAVNAVLHPSLKDVRTSLSEIFACLNDSGVLLSVFPSMEAVLHNSMLVYEREFGKDEARSLTRARRITERGKYDVLRGVYADGLEIQKLFYKPELVRRLREAGFSRVRFKRISYPWGKTGDFEDFPGEEPMWDWYVIASKN